MYILLSVSKLQCHRRKQDRVANRLFKKGWGTFNLLFGQAIKLCETYIHSSYGKF